MAEPQKTTRFGVIGLLTKTSDNAPAGEAWLGYDSVSGQIQASLNGAAWGPFGVGQDPANVAITGGTIVGTNTATPTTEGLMSAADKAKLNGIGTGSLDAGTLQTLAVDATDWDFATGLNGDLDGEYEGRFEIQCANVAGTPLYSLQPEAVSANQISLDLYSPTATTAAAEKQSFLNVVGFAASNGRKAVVRWKLGAKLGVWRQWSYEVVAMNAGNTDISFVECGSGVWMDTTTNITKLRLHCSVAAGIKAGSVARWRKTGFST